MVLLIITSKEDRAILDNMFQKIKPVIEPIIESAVSDGVLSSNLNSDALRASGKDLLRYLSKLISK